MNKLTKVDGYLVIPLKSIAGKAIGTAIYPEPVYYRGIFQNKTIDVLVEIWPSKITHPDTKNLMVAVRFGQMAFLRYIDMKLLTNIQYYDSERKGNG